ncbi:MAG: hypothetical protein ACK5N8_08730 [Alphaproteobacteria bacterium]
MEIFQILRYVTLTYFLIFLGLNFAWLVFTMFRHPEEFIEEWLTPQSPKSGYNFKDSLSYSSLSKKINVGIYVFFITAITIVLTQINWFYSSTLVWIVLFPIPLAIMVDIAFISYIGLQKLGIIFSHFFEMAKQKLLK